jgi:hypothetical protein
LIVDDWWLIVAKTMLIRLLDIEKDASVFREAWDWAREAPRWFRDAMDVWKETFEEQMEAARNELHYGVFLDDEPAAVIRLIEAWPWVFNIHLSARRRTPLDVLVEAGSTLRDFLFAQGVKGFYGYIPTQNRGVIRLYEALGFFDSGVRCFKGMTHGRVIEWKHMVTGRGSGQ